MIDASGTNSKQADELRCGDDVIAYVSVHGIDNYAVLAHVQPGPAWEQYRHYFEEEQRLSRLYDEQDSDEAHDAWMELLDRINALGLYLVRPTERACPSATCISTNGWKRNTSTTDRPDSSASTPTAPGSWNIFPGAGAGVRG